MRSLVLAQEAGTGQIVFNNRVAGEVEAPIKRLDGTGAGPSATAQLMLVAEDGELKPLTPTTRFRGGSPEEAYFVESKDVSLGLVQPWETVTLRIRAWEGSSLKRPPFAVSQTISRSRSGTFQDWIRQKIWSDWSGSRWCLNWR